MAELQIRALRKTYPGAAAPVLQGIDLDVAAGEFMVFVGPSGCGKSTLLRAIAGLEPVDGGDILLDGASIAAQPPGERGVAMVFQSYALYPHLTVAANLGFPLKMQGLGKDEIRRQVNEVAQTLQIEPLLERLPKALSGGQRQRVAIGRAIVRKPKVFLFDEPLSNLDAALRVNMRIELSRLHKELGTTMIYVTHDQVEAMTMGSRIAVFNKGQVEQLGAPMALYNQPDNEFVATFLGAPRINLIDRPAANAAPAHQALWQLLAASAPALAQRVALRPEHLRLAPAGQGIPATVVLAEHLGDVSILYLRVEGVSDLLNAKIATGHDAQCAAGQTVGLAPDASWALAFGADGRLLTR